MPVAGPGRPADAAGAGALSPIHRSGDYLSPRRLLAESLRVGVDFTVPEMTLTRCGRHDVSDSTSATQPKVWTFIDFQVPEDHADVLAAALADSLLPEDGRYAARRVRRRR